MELWIFKPHCKLVYQKYIKLFINKIRNILVTKAKDYKKTPISWFNSH